MIVNAKKIILFILLPIITVFCSCKIDKNVIYTSHQLKALLNSLEYKGYSAETTGNLPITDDIEIVGTVTISSDQLEIPEGCLNNNHCRQSVGFFLPEPIEGVQLKPLSEEEYPPCVLTLKNVRLRFRTLRIDTTFYTNYSTTPVIVLMPPSNYECKDSEIKCDTDNVCYDTYNSYCLSCLALSQEECACRNRNGALADGESCKVIISADAYVNGTCQNGKCIADW